MSHESIGGLVAIAFIAFYFAPLIVVAWRAEPKSKRKSLAPAIADQIDKALERLDAPIELRSIIGSYGDTLDDKEVLELLKSWNETGKVLHERQ
jgi:hypothetical protein